MLSHEYKELKSIKDFRDTIKTKEDILENCQMRLFNAKNLPNGLSLNDVYANPYLNMAICSSVLKSYYKDGKRFTESYLLTKKDYKDFQLDLNEVTFRCEKNIRSKNQPKVSTLFDAVIRQNLLHPIFSVPKNAVLKSKGEFPGGTEDTLAFPGDETEENILMITNRYQSFSAIGMTDPKTIEEVSSKFKEEPFYFIPISIHDVLCVKQSHVIKNGEKSIKEAEEDLLDMLEGFNDSVNKNTQDILSYQIYLYEENRTFQIRRVN